MGPPRAVTLDFHDTIAIAPSWYALEVRQLPGMVLHDLAVRGLLNHNGARMARASEIYRALRREIQVHGREQDALACVQHTLHALDIAVPDSAVASVIDDLMGMTHADATPRPGIHEAVRDFADAGIPLAVISNAVYHPFLERCLAEWGLADAFTAVITSASCGYYKSHAGIYRCALAALGVAPDEAVHIGDSYRYDIEPAHRLGMRAVWLHLNGDRPEPCVADRIVTDLMNLAPHVLSLT